MPTMIAKKNKKNQRKVQKRLDGKIMTFRFVGHKELVVTAGEGLLWGFDQLRGRGAYLALGVANQLIAEFPDIVDAYILRVKALILLEELVLASEALEALKTSAPENAGIEFLSGKIKLHLGDAQSALRHLLQALKQDSNSIEVIESLASCYSLIGEKEKAGKIAAKALEKFAGKRIRDTAAKKSYISTLLLTADFLPLTEAQIQSIEAASLSDDFNDEEKAAMVFRLASNAKKTGSLDREVVYLQGANRLQAKAIKHQHTTKSYFDLLDAQYKTQIELFSAPDSLVLSPCLRDIDFQPVFIIGMPRSGTTLQEQMLGAHSKVGQAGESKALAIGITNIYRRFASGFGLADYPIKLESIDKRAICGIADYYARHQRLLSDAELVLDKELSGFSYVGLSAQLFPHAKFIHLNRAPMDTFLSCYRGGIPGIPATCDIEHMVVYYEYMKKLVGHWRRLYPERVHIVDYAELVEKPVEVTKGTLSFLGLDWEDSIMNFHKRKNVVRTLSVNQVKKEIYKTSLNSWLPFEDMLKPAKNLLQKKGIPLSGVQYL